MSSPPLNCFLAAARTASLIASITRSRSMPCSWQRASMFCAILVLIWWVQSSLALVLSDQVAVDRLLFLGFAKLALDVYLKVCFDDRIEREGHSTAGSIFKNHVAVFNSGNATAEIPLVTHRLAHFELGVAPGKSFVISQLIKAALQPRRRNFQCVSRVNEI